MHNALPYLRLLVLGGLLAACGAPDPPARPATDTARRPNVVLVVMDTLRADRVEASRNGVPVMPFLARMAREGTYFANAISPCSWTKPALASVFTGVWPDRHGVVYSARDEDPEHPTSDVLADGWETMAEWLASQGYTPWGFQTNANLTRPLGFAQGFADDHYHFQNGAPAPAVTASALGGLAALEPPFFLYAHYMDPHAPYTPDPAVRDVLGEEPAITDYDRAVLADDERFMAYYLDQVKTALGLQPRPTIQDLSTAGKEAVRHRYDLECLAMDRAIEALFTAVRAEYPDTIFVFLSDHGEEFWERGGMGHGTTLHREQVHVPFIIFDPARSPSRVDEMVSTLTLLPHLAARLELPQREAWAALEGPAFSYTRGPWPSLMVHQSAVFLEGYAYLRDHATDTARLYNLQTDPGEQHDLLQTRPGIGARMRDLLQARSADSRGAPAPPATLSEAEIEALEALGYIDPAGPAMRHPAESRDRGDRLPSPSSPGRACVETRRQARVPVPQEPATPQHPRSLLGVQPPAGSATQLQDRYALASRRQSPRSPGRACVEK